MSQVGSFVRRADDTWLGDPTVGVDGNWFVCWDDDDPDELVIANDCPIQDPQVLLARYGLMFRVTSRRPECSSRVFGQKPSGDWLFKKAKSYWLRATGPLPVDAPLIKQGKLYTTKPTGQGVYHYGSKHGRID